MFRTTAAVLPSSSLLVFATWFALCETAHADNALSVAVVADATTPSGFRGVRLPPWTYTGRTVIGGEAADRKLASMMQALKQNVKTYGQLQQRYQFVLAECPGCNPATPTGSRDPRMDTVSWRLCPESRENTCARREGAKTRLLKG
jgi:hypothetical protein